VCDTPLAYLFRRRSFADFLLLEDGYRQALLTATFRRRDWWWDESPDFPGKPPRKPLSLRKLRAWRNTVRTAAHEAGHAVIAHTIGLKTDRVTIYLSSHERDRHPGCAGLCYYDYRSRPALSVEEDLLCSLGGYAAERVLMGRPSLALEFPGSWSVMRDAVAYTDWEACQRAWKKGGGKGCCQEATLRLRRQAYETLAAEPNRSALELVTCALLHTLTFGGKDLDRCIRMAKHLAAAKAAVDAAA
jgi:hypothetical protein